MIRPTALLVFLMLSASLAGCIEDPIVVEPVPEEDPAIDDTDEVINGSNGGSGTDTGTGNGNTDDGSNGEPVNGTGNGNDNTARQEPTSKAYLLRLGSSRLKTGTNAATSRNGASHARERHSAQ